MSGEVELYLVHRTEPDEEGWVWWSNEGGWSTLDEAIVYTPQERAACELPGGGEWVRFLDVEDSETVVPKDSCEAEHPTKHLQCHGAYGHEQDGERHYIGDGEEWD